MRKKKRKDRRNIMYIYLYTKKEINKRINEDTKTQFALCSIPLVVINERIILLCYYILSDKNLIENSARLDA